MKIGDLALVLKADRVQSLRLLDIVTCLKQRSPYIYREVVVPYLLNR